MVQVTQIVKTIEVIGGTNYNAIVFQLLLKVSKSCYCHKGNNAKWYEVKTIIRLWE